MKNLFLLSCLFLFSCGQNLGTNEGSEFKVFDINPSAIRFADINELIMGPKCLSCHGWALDEAEFDKRIVAGEPENSALYQQISSGAMPLGGPELTASEKELVYNYILNKVSTVVATKPQVEEPDNPGEQGPSVEALALLEEVKTTILIPNCQSCHGWVSNDKFILGKIKPGLPEESTLYKVVKNDFMPQFSLPLMPEEKELIKEMIIAFGE